MTEWIGKWKKNNWKTSGREEVKNKEDYILLDAACEGIEIDWVGKYRILFLLPLYPY